MRETRKLQIVIELLEEVNEETVSQELSKRIEECTEMVEDIRVDAFQERLRKKTEDR